MSELVPLTSLFSTAFPIIPAHLIISVVLNNCLFKSGTSIVDTAQFQDWHADKIPQASPDCGSHFSFRAGSTKCGGARSWIVSLEFCEHLRCIVCCHRSSLFYHAPPEVGAAGPGQSGPNSAFFWGGQLGPNAKLSGARLSETQLSGAQFA